MGRRMPKINTDVTNLFEQIPTHSNEELFLSLAELPNLTIERIVSYGQTTAPDQWYDQARHEWIILLRGEAELTYADGNSSVLRAGDIEWIPAHRRHRVSYTSTDEPSIWLAIHCD